MTLKPGAVVGELALQNNEARAATIKCATRCRFLVIQKEAFQEVMRASVAWLAYCGRTKSISHHVEAMGNHGLLVFTGESSFQGFLGGVGFRPSTVVLGEL